MWRTITLILSVYCSSCFALNFDGLNSHIYQLADQAYQCAIKKNLIHNPTLTIVDFDRPSTQKRLWVIDMKRHRVLDLLRVAHGLNSGNIYARHFSNKDNSLESSLGAMITATAYYGQFGYSLRLNGLETGINSNVYMRDIVVHGSRYVSPKTLRQFGRIGRSYGCFMLNKNDSRKVINQIKGGSMIFAFAPQEIHDHNISQCHFSSARLNT